MMLCRGVVIWRGVKHSTSTWRGGGKTAQVQSGEAKVRILTIKLRVELQGERHSVCMHLRVEVNKS